MLFDNARHSKFMLYINVTSIKYKIITGTNGSSLAQLHRFINNFGREASQATKIHRDTGVQDENSTIPLGEEGQATKATTTTSTSTDTTMPRIQLQCFTTNLFRDINLTKTPDT